LNVAQKAPSEKVGELRNTALAIALGLLMAAVLIVSTGRARAARSAVDDDAELAPHLRTPLPMNAIPDGPSRPPPAFRELRENGQAVTRLSPYEERQIVQRAREELTRVTTYDNTWMETSGYPMGDVPESRGACTDVVVRSLRAIGVDLQKLVHEDMAADGKPYGAGWTDHHIDHRRVGTMFTFFQRHAMSLTTDPRKPGEFRPGDVVFYSWQWGKVGTPEHVAVVSDKLGPRGLPLVIQNGGPKPVENDTLDRGKIIGHFRAVAKP
jgi:uncharacterized protein